MWLVLLLIVVVTLYLFYESRRGPIPKIIWTYWHDKDHMPETVKKCIDSWKRHCPDYDIRILGDSDTIHFKHSNDFIQRHADFVRLDVLNEHGGVWLDASVFLNSPIDWIHEDPSVDFAGYEFRRHTLKPEWPYIENWFMAVPKGSRFIREWYEEFFRYNDYESIDDYLRVEMADVDGTEIPNKWYHLPYLACQKCIQKRGPYKLNLRLADNDGFKHLEDVSWRSDLATENVCNGMYENTKLIKLTNSERNVMESKIKSCNFLNRY